MQKSEATIGNSNNYTERFIESEVTRQKAESIAREYITEIMTRQEVAKYLISDTFKITGRGLVFVGYITEGLVSIGNTIEFTAINNLYRRKIIGVEEIKKSQSDKINTGLLINCDNDKEIVELGNQTKHMQLYIKQK